MYGMARVTSRTMPARSPSAPRRAVILGLAAALGIAGAPACSGSDRLSETPEPALGSSRPAQEEFRALHHRWAGASRPERLAMEIELESFRARYPTDDQVRMADALLAWVALEKGDLARAFALSRRVQARGAGTPRDLAQTIEGVVLRRQGKPEEALAKLLPIVSKLIDGYARTLLNEEVVASALAARRWEKAVELMSVWLREADEEERDLVRARIEQRLSQVPPDELNKILDRRLALGATDLPQNESDIQKLLARQLAAVARARKDVKLAQQLIAKSAPLLGDQGDAVAQLAAGAGRARVEAPTVGLLLSLRSDAARRRGAEVAAGVMHGLGLPGSSARLASRDDGGSLQTVADALSGLTAEGAAVIVAGVDQEEADEAAAFAETNGIPVVLLVPPSRPIKPGGFVFVAGISREEVRDALVGGLAEDGTSRIALITDPTSLDAHATTGSPSTNPKVLAVKACGEIIDPGMWKTAGMTGVVIDGGPECARTTLTATSGLAVRYALGFDALAIAPAGALVPVAGRYPIVAQATSEAWLDGWRRYRQTPPSFWSGLGRDAGVLSWAGVQALPATGTEDPKEVQARRGAARDALASATADLWTTDARGFEGGRVLPRKLRTTELEGRRPNGKAKGR